MGTHITKHVYLVRHGETSWNKQGKIQGHSDIPLNQRGMEQAQLLAGRLKDWPIQYICSSDLQRAIRTAERIAEFKNQKVHVYPQLRERHYGQLEGQEYPAVQPKLKEGHLFGVESFECLKERGMAFILSLLETTEASHILIVSHGGLINSVIHEMTRGKYGTGITKLTNTSLTHAEFTGGQWLIHLINDDQHLQEREK